MLYSSIELVRITLTRNLSGDSPDHFDISHTKSVAPHCYQKEHEILVTTAPHCHQNEHENLVTTATYCYQNEHENLETTASYCHQKEHENLVT